MNDSGSHCRRALLDAVVADRGRGVERLVDVARLEDVALARSSAPQTPAKQSACSSSRTESAFALVGPLLLRAPRSALGDAEEVLHVVADLVRDHVGLREVAGRAEASLAARR